MKKKFLMLFWVGALGFADTFSGSYMVPAPWTSSGEALSKVAKITWEKKAEKFQLSYPLPADLVGPEKVVISLSETSQTSFGAVEVKGGKGFGSCTFLKKKVVCTINYDGLRIDAPAVKKFLEDKYESPELEKRLSLARSFEADPGGVLTILLDTKKP